MTQFHPHRAAANQHFKPVDRVPTSTFDTVTSAAKLTREKAARLRRNRMESEDAAAAIRLPDMTGRPGK